MTTAVQPAKRFRLGSIHLSIWPNTDRKGRTFYTTTIGRSFRDEKGEWRDSGSLRPSDMPVVRTLTTQAMDWLTANPPGNSVEAPKQSAEQHRDPAIDPSLAKLLIAFEQQLIR